MIADQPAGGHASSTRARRSTLRRLQRARSRSTVPDVVGKSVDEAQRDARGRRASRSTCTEQETDDEDPGTVLAQNPAAGDAGRQGLDGHAHRRQGAAAGRRARRDRRGRRTTRSTALSEAGLRGRPARARTSTRPTRTASCSSRTRPAAEGQEGLDGDDRRRQASTPTLNPEPTPTTTDADADADARRRRREGRRPRRRALVRARGLAGLAARRCARACARPATRSSTCRARARRRRGGTTARSWRCAPARGLLGADVVVPGAARAVRRGRHGPGPARAARRPLRRLGRARLRRCAWTRSSSRTLMARAGLPQVGLRRRSTRRARDARRVARHRGARAARAGSSRRGWARRSGIVAVGDADELDAGARRSAFAHDPRVIVEAHARRASRSSARCSGRPTAPQASAARARSSCSSGAGWYDYEAKYTPRRHGARRARRGSPTPRASGVRELAVDAFRLRRLQRPGARRLLRRRRRRAAQRAQHDARLHRRRASTRSSGRRSGLPYPELVRPAGAASRSSASSASAYACSRDVVGGRLGRLPCWVRRDAWSPPVYGIPVPDHPSRR